MVRAPAVWDLPFVVYPLRMKTLVLLGVVAAIAAVLYKVLTTEIPIDA